MLLQAQQTLLPELRQDLQLMQGAPTVEGHPCWLVYDPVRHRYFEIPQNVFEILSAWVPGEPALMRARAATMHQRQISDQEIEDVVYFVNANSLCMDPPGGDSQAYFERFQKMQRGWLSVAIHNYLFFRVPLFRPQRFLQRTYPFVAPLFSKTALTIVALISLLGLYLVSREWGEFAGTFFALFLV